MTFNDRDDSSASFCRALLFEPGKCWQGKWLSRAIKAINTEKSAIYDLNDLGPLEMRAIAFGFEKTAAFQNDHAHHEQEESNTPPINFFHSRNCVYFYNGESSQITEYQRKF